MTHFFRQKSEIFECISDLINFLINFMNVSRICFTFTFKGLQKALYGCEFAVSDSDSHSGSDSTLVLGSLDVLACVGLPDLGAI